MLELVMWLTLASEMWVEMMHATLRTIEWFSRYSLNSAMKLTCPWVGLCILPGWGWRCQSWSWPLNMFHEGRNRPCCFKSLRFGFLFLLLVALLSLSWLIQQVAAWITFRIQQGTLESPSLVSFLWFGTFRRDTFSYRFCVVLQGFPMESEIKPQPCS